MKKKSITIALISLSVMIVIIATGLVIKSGKMLKINISLVDRDIDYSENIYNSSKEDASELSATELNNSEYARSIDNENTSESSALTTTINSIISTTLKTISNLNQTHESININENTSKANTATLSTTKINVSNENSSSGIKSRIRVFEVNVRGIDSAGGVSPGIYWRNESNKTIKYIYFDFKPYNAVGDSVNCSIRGYSTHTCYITGPIEKTELGQYILWPKYDLNGDPMGYDGWERVETWDIVKGDYGEPNVMNHARGWTKNRLIYLTQEEIKRTARYDDWDRVWYNGDITTIKIVSIKIEYMDGETFYIGQSQIQQVFW